MSWAIERVLSERDDLDEIVAIEQACFTNPWTRQMYLRELQNPDVSFSYVLRLTGFPGEQGPIVGFCCFWLVLDEIHINNLAVRAECQGRGYGSALLEHVLEVGASRGARRATLEVRRSNAAARRLYRAPGFRGRGDEAELLHQPARGRADPLALSRCGQSLKPRRRCATFDPTHDESITRIPQIPNREAEHAHRKLSGVEGILVGPTKGSGSSPVSIRNSMIASTACPQSRISRNSSSSRKSR